MRVTFQQLIAFKAVVETGSITQAAKQLALTQPAVSNLLKQLAQYYGTRLLECDKGKVELSHCGEIVYKTALQIHHALKQSESSVNLAQGKLAGSLNVSVVSTAKYFMPRLLAQFKERHPAINPVIKVCNREQVIERLKDRADDFVIMSQPPKDMSVDIETLYEDKLVVASSANLSKGYNKPIDLMDLQDKQWLVREQGSGTRMVMDKVFRNKGLTPKSSMEVGNNESIKQLIIAGMGISIVSLQSIELELHNHLMDVLPVDGFPIDHHWYIVTRRNKSKGSLTQAFRVFLQQHPELTHCQEPAIAD